FEFDERAEPVHFIEVDSGLAEQQQDPMLAYDSTHAERMSEHAAQSVRGRYARDEIVRQFRTGLVAANVGDQFGGAITELTEFQPAAWHVKERVRLPQLAGGNGAERFDSLPNHGEIRRARLDFDVPRHQRASSGATKSSVSMPFSRVHCTRRTR